MLKKQRGFSLVETLIVIGVLGIITLGSATLFVNMSKNLKRIDLKQSESSLIQEIKTIISDKESCQASLVAGQAYNNGKARQNVPDFKQARANRGMPFQLRLMGSGDRIRPNQDLDSYGLKTGFMNITNSQRVGPATASGQLYRGRIWGHFEPPNDEFTFKPKLIGGFYFNVNPGNRINECFSLNEDDETKFNDLFEKICQGMGGTVQGGQCQLGRLDGCQHGNPPRCQKHCPPMARFSDELAAGYTICTPSGWKCIPPVCLDTGGR